jgi:phospholipase C
MAMAATVSGRAQQSSPGVPAPSGLTGIHKVRHVIVVMMDNRSFDRACGPADMDGLKVPGVHQLRHAEQVARLGEQPGRGFSARLVAER